MKTLFFSLLSVSIAWAELPVDYQTWKGCEKRDYLFEKKIEPSKYNILPPYITGGFQALLGAGALLDLDRSFTHSSDEMPEGRLKIIHTYGSVAAVQFEAAEDSPYSGLFQGACGLVRLGWAAPPAPLVGYIPGMAIKLFIDGLASANMHVMNSLDGQGRNANFFEKTFSNELERPSNPLLLAGVKVFEKFVSNALLLDVSHVALFDQNALQAREVKAPQRIYFIPTGEVQLPKVAKKDLRLQLEEIPRDTVLYNVYGEEENGEQFYMGQLTTVSRFVASSYGDQKLFFQHSDTFLRDEFRNE